MDNRRRILFVCTANICRSPSAEYLARTRFGSEKFHFRSAGFLTADRSCPSDLEHVLNSRSIQVSGHRSYRLDADTIHAAELILTMEARHVLEATVLDRAALAKSLPLKEAAKLVAGPESVEDFLRRVNTDRDPQRYLGETNYDISDPYKKRMKAYERAVEEIDDLVNTVISSLN